MAQKYLPFEEAVERYNNGQQWYDTTREIPVSAPVKKKKKKDKFFDSGAFSDGYQFGDVTKAILGTGADVVTSAGKGVWDVGQGTAKLIVGGIAEAADLFGKDEYADKLRDRLTGKDEKVNKRLENIDVFGRTNKVADKSSVLGEKTDRVFESVGQIGAYTIPVLGQASMFTSSAGSNLSEAYSKGATDAQAWTKALIGGGISVATEKLFGLFGESGLDTALADKISSKLTSGIAKTLARQGVQATAEGVEEVIEYTGDQLLDWAIDKVSNGKGAKLKEDWNWEEVGESFANAFISSALVGAGQTAIGVKQSGGINEYASQVDSASGMLTENEQKVLDNVIEQRIEEATQNQDLSKKEIRAIETQAKEDLQSGNISVETIENTLGLKNYINDVITDVQNKMGRQLTQEEANGISQLTRNRFLENLQNDRLLQNSYNENNKKSQAFTYELTDKDSEYKANLYKSAENKANDTTLTHKFVDSLAKLSEDRNVQYLLTNNEELANNKYAIKDKLVNGLVDENGNVLINIDSNKSLNSIVGHETTHLLEGTQEYQDLQDSILEYAKSRGDYESRLSYIQELYKDIANVDVNGELTADLVGDYLFTDENFINNLSTQKPTLFQKIKNLIDDLVVKFTGTKQEKELRKVQRSFEKAYRESSKTQTSNSNIKYSISEKTGKLQENGKDVSLETSDTGTTGTLMAIHNLNEDKLKGILELGGFPVPSIAITNPSKINHEGYGNISVLFDKNTIDPAISGNEVYDRDVWSPRFPNISREIIEPEIDKAAPKIGISDSSLQSLAEEYNNIDDLAYRLSRDSDIVDKYLDDNNIKVDGDAIPRKIAEENGIVNYIKKQINGIYGEKGIYNNKSYLDDNGNRRSFWQLHDKYNLENIVKNLTSQDTVSSETSVFGAGFGNIQANMSNKFNTIDDIKNNESRIMASEEAATKVQPIIDSLNDEMIELSKLYGDKFDPLWDMDSINYQLQEFSKLKNLTQEGFYNIAKTYNPDLAKANPKLVNKIINTMNELKAIPTDYFEAKPQRAVGLDEVQQIVIPNNLDSEFKKQLQDNGLQYTEYDPNVEGDRQRVINQFDDLKFSLSNQNEDIAPVGDYNVYGEQIKRQVNDAIAPLKDSIDEINKSIEKVMDNIAPVVEQANSALEEKIAKNKEIIDKIDYDKLYDKLSAKDILMDQANRYAALNYGEEYIPPQINIDEQGNKQVIPKEKSAARQAKDTFKRLFTNSNVEIDNLAEESGNKNIKYAGDMLNSVMGEAQGDISVAQTNNNGEAIGKSLNEIFSEANNSGLSEAFNDYLIQQSNIDRHEQGKGSIVPTADSELLVREYEKTYPQFKEWAKDVYQYGANTRANLVDAGIISQELSDKLANMYPHYVPFITDSKNINNIINDTGEIIPKNTIKRAKGGANIGQVLPVQEALERYTYSQKKAVRQNQLYQQIVGTLSDGAIDIGADMREFDNNDFTSMSDSLYRDENGNYLTAYVDGERKSVRISEDLYNSLSNDLQNRVKDFENKFRFVTKPLQKISEVRRNLLTTWNPSFALTNPIKDIQDASLNSKYPTAMAKNVPRAVNELFRNDTDRVRQFRTLYGAVNAFGEFENNTLNQKAKNNKFVRNLINFNENMELAPRYAEFLASVENGASIQEAMYNAREVTTNFSRGGVIAKALNRNGFTFLNANIQGLSKFVRNIKGENGIRGTVGALTRAAVLGIAPAVFNEIAFGAGDDKDEEYEALPDYVKDNYYIIKTSDGNFIRIPKGRMLSIFGSAARRTIEAVEGEENAFEGYLKNAYDQVGVANPLNNNILAPLIQAFGSENGTNWYGGDLVPTRLQNVPKGEQTDATIDAFSTWLGEKLNVSPYKINYVLDQYSGGIGDIFLPMMTQEATNDQSSLTGQLLAPIKDKFTVNATDDNKYVSDFYSKSEELQVKANSKNATDEDALRQKYMYSISKGMSELYKERREVQADESLTKEEKYAKSQAIKDEINRLAKAGLDGYNNIEGYGNYMVVGDDIGYYKNAKGEWKPISEDDITFIESQGLTDREKSDYFSTKNDIGLIVDDYKDKLEGVDDADTKNQLYASKKKEIAQEIQQMEVPDETKAYMFDKYYSSADTLKVITDSKIDFNTYLDFASQTFTADKNKEGKTISGSKKQKVYNYINSMNNLNYGEKCILAKLEYKSDNRYNNQIIQYLNNSNLDYDTEASILKELGFKVSDDGRISW